MPVTGGRVRHLVGSAIVLAFCLAGAPADAQSYPARPVQVIVPYAGGSASDVAMRVLLDRMGASMGRTFVVDNRPGAGGNIGTAAGAKAAPDGYKVGMGGVGPR